MQGRIATSGSSFRDVEGVARVIEGLEAERRALVARLTTRRGSAALDEGTLVQMAERWAGEARATLQGSPEAARRSFEALLSGRRMEVHSDEARGFRVEGLFDVPWMREAPLEPLDSQGGITGSGGAIRASADSAARAALPASLGRLTPGPAGKDHGKSK
jgi:hypothetical protein